jgi:hypothetical protein
MKKLMLKIAALSLLLVVVPMATQAETSWTTYKPGLVKEAIAKGETVLLGYLSSW